MPVLEPPAGAPAPGPMAERVVVELRHGVGARGGRGVAAPEAGEDVAEEAADGAPVRGRGLPGPPRDPPGRAAAVEPGAVHLRVHDGELPLLGRPPAGESTDREPTAGEPPDGEPDRGLLLLLLLKGVGVGGHLVAADGAGVAEREPGEDAVGVVDVGAGHFPGLGAQVEGLLADGAVRVGGGDGDDGHGLDGGLGRRRRGVAGAGRQPAGGLDLRQLVQQALEARAHEEVGHGLRERAEARPRAVVVQELEAAGGGRGAAEHDDGVEGRGRAGVGGVVRAGAAEVGRSWRRRAHLLEEAAAAGGAGGGGEQGGGAHEAVALVAPVGGGGRWKACGGRGGRHLHRKAGSDLGYFQLQAAAAEAEEGLVVGGETKGPCILLPARSD
uniref:Uncharacterized protein n=1 Tax=Zea mays TaxID=4577 RepID=C4J2P4_MAIZE|nr:unknown [Zea mays]